MIRAAIYRFVPVFLAIVYISFQVEPFDEEFEKNNPRRSAGINIDYPTENWESHGKANVREAFAFDCTIPIVLLLLLVPLIGRELPPLIPFRLLLNKAPPAAAA